jgi:hypothetical protein
MLRNAQIFRIRCRRACCMGRDRLSPRQPAYAGIEEQPQIRDIYASFIPWIGDGTGMLPGASG